MFATTDFSIIKKSVNSLEKLDYSMKVSNTWGDGVIFLGVASLLDTVFL